MLINDVFLHNMMIGIIIKNVLILGIMKLKILRYYIEIQFYLTLNLKNFSWSINFIFVKCTY